MSAASSVRPLLTFVGRTSVSVGFLDDAPEVGTIVPTILHPELKVRIPDIASAKVLTITQGELTVGVNLATIKEECEQLPGTVIEIPDEENQVVTVGFNSLTPVLLTLADMRAGLKPSVVEQGGDFIVIEEYDPNHQPADLCLYITGTLADGKPWMQFIPKFNTEGNVEKTFRQKTIIKPGYSIQGDLEAIRDDGTELRYYGYEVRATDPRTLR